MQNRCKPEVLQKPKRYRNYWKSQKIPFFSISVNKTSSTSGTKPTGLCWDIVKEARLRGTAHPVGSFMVSVMELKRPSSDGGGGNRGKKLKRREALEKKKAVDKLIGAAYSDGDPLVSFPYFRHYSRDDEHEWAIWIGMAQRGEGEAPGNGCS
ncbi:uncharacterized protein LOC116212835 [Punica granatum]|uniref:Uncharacterized protein LOC116212835 n=1 Tax=Punica granatum TaxID=22663 RepID=A0A6P8E7U5_PUNGR|nr:uncharacterized protein LOC116212835 [Punica granatum]